MRVTSTSARRPGPSSPTARQTASGLAALEEIDDVVGNSGAATEVDEVAEHAEPAAPDCEKTARHPHLLVAGAGRASCFAQPGRSRR
jgi:hypothetical protein